MEALMKLWWILRRPQISRSESQSLKCNNDKDVEERGRIIRRKRHRDSDLSIRSGPAPEASIKPDRLGDIVLVWTFHTHAALSRAPEMALNWSQFGGCGSFRSQDASKTSASTLLQRRIFIVDW